MGWYYTYGATRRDVIRELTENRSAIVERRACVGNVLWTVEHNLSGRWIGCYLLSRGTGDGWGHKPMSEAMGPYYYSCPLSFLDAVPEADAAWRARVREYHASRLPPLRKGMRVTLKAKGFPGVFTLTQKTTKGWRATGPDGFNNYHVRRSVVASIVS